MTQPAPPRRDAHLLALVIAAILSVLLAGCGSATTKTSPSTATATAKTTAPTATSIATPAPTRPPTIPQIPESTLPAEARTVIHRIQTGAPSPYRQDGATFANREGRLPAEPPGYYREYTVPTPGAADRGARRLILGRDGELYYTPDHYRSFQWVLRGDTS